MSDRERAQRRGPGRGVAGRAGVVGILLGLAVGVGAAIAEPRFPPPDFTSGYALPVSQHPLPRALVWQYVDVAVLVGALGLASWLTLKGRSRRGVMGLSIFSLLYFGFYREGCICAIGSVQNVALALGDRSYALPLITLIFFVAPLVTALFFGRSFCAAVCPHGALQDLVLVRPVTVPRWLAQGLGVIPFLYLGAGVLLAATGSGFVICRLDPFVPLFRMTGSFPLLLTGAAFIAVGLFIGRPYCRFLCPYGALLRLASMVSKWNVRITPDRCTQCRLCEEACPFGVIREPVTVALSPAVLGRERVRFLALVVALPVLLGVGGWAGMQFAGGLATLHREVDLAGLYLQQRSESAVTNLPVADQLALGRAGREAASLLPSAVDRQRTLRWGGAVFGGFAGLVIGLRLLGFSFWSRRLDYEPDRGECVGCARCFLSCPQERVRCGLMRPEDAPQGPPVGAVAGGTPVTR